MVWKSEIVRYKEIKSWNENDFKTHLTGEKKRKRWIDLMDSKSSDAIKS